MTIPAAKSAAPPHPSSGIKRQQIFREQIHRIKNPENNLRQKNKSAHISQNSAGHTRRTCIHQIFSADLTIRKAERFVGSNQTAVLLHHTGYRRQADENGNNEKYHREHRTDRLNRRRIALHIGITAQRRAILYIPLCHVNVRNLLLFLRNRLIEVRKIFFIFCLAVRVFRLTFKQLFPSFGEIFLTVLYLRRSLLVPFAPAAPRLRKAPYCRSPALLSYRQSAIFRR